MARRWNRPAGPSIGASATAHTGTARSAACICRTCATALNRLHQLVYNLQNKDPYFLDILFQDSAVEEILKHFLNDEWYREIPANEPNYILRSYLARSSRGAMPLHVDSFIPYIGNRSIVMQCAIVLQPMSVANGATLVLPRSHISGEYATQQALQDAVALEARPGDVLIWDSRLWHGAAANSSGIERWLLIATFCRWWIKQGFDLPRALPQYIYARLSPKQKAILGYCSVPFHDETEGIDFRRGYCSLE